jgi:hypothetical protein
VANGADDLFGVWRTLLQQWETQANAAINSVTGQEGFSREMNRSMSAALQMQAAFNEAVNKALATFNLPSRDDVARLSEQIRALERKIDALAEPTGSNGAGPNGAAPVPPKRPARTRRPPERDA